jgi:aspartate/methionine/tyrosine aminotransferase
MAIDVVGNYLRLSEKRLGLIEPCFDSLSHTFLRHCVALVPFPDDTFGEPSFRDQLKALEVGAVFLVNPNNPTGNILPERQFRELIQWCVSNGVLLIMDCCFRSYIPDALAFDQYRLLSESGVDYILIEDTGKTWFAGDLKAPFLTVSAGIFADVNAIHTDLLLNVSPFVLSLMMEFMRQEPNGSRNPTIEIVQRNRELLYRTIEGTLLAPQGYPYSGFAWLSIAGGYSSRDMVEKLDQHGVSIIPGEPFFWSNTGNGTRFARIALAREPDMFAEAAAIIGAVCRELSANPVI